MLDVDGFTQLANGKRQFMVPKTDENEALVNALKKGGYVGSVKTMKDETLLQDYAIPSSMQESVCVYSGHLEFQFWLPGCCGRSSTTCNRPLACKALKYECQNACSWLATVSIGIGIVGGWILPIAHVIDFPAGITSDTNHS